MTIRELTPELAEVAKNELGEDPSRIPSDLQAIKEWLSKQRHFSARTDDQWLIAFLRGCKYSLERTKEKLDNYHTMKTMIPEISKAVDPMDPKIQEMLNLGVNIVLPKLSAPDSARVIIVRPGAYDPSKFTPLESMGLTNMFADLLLLEDDNTAIVGNRYIIDLKNVSMGHFIQMTPTNIKKMVMSGQEGMPIRDKGTHHINFPSGVETIFALFKTFMNEKSRTRIHMHSEDKMDELYKFVPKDILPAEYGGNGGTIQSITDDQWLLAFLRGCKHSLERTKEKIDFFYTMKTMVPEISDIVDPMEVTIQEIVNLGFSLVLPKTAAPDAPRVLILRVGYYDPNKFNLLQCMGVFSMHLDMLLNQDDTTNVVGHRCIIDMKNLTMRHVTLMTPAVIKKLVMFFQGGLPIRDKGTHIINMSFVPETIINLIKSYMNEKSGNRVFFHNDMRDLYKYVPKDILPEEYGGNGESVQSIIDIWKKDLESHRDWLLEGAQYRTDESKRLGKPKTFESLFGIEGSFRQLNVD